MGTVTDQRYTLTHVDHGFECIVSVQRICIAPIYFLYVPHHSKIHIPKVSGLMESNIAVYKHNNNGDVNAHIIMDMLFPNRRMSYRDGRNVSTSVGWLNDIYTELFNVTSQDLKTIANSKKDHNGKLKYSTTLPIKDVFWYTAYDSSREKQKLQTRYGICLSVNELYNQVIVPNLSIIK